VVIITRDTEWQGLIAAVQGLDKQVRAGIRVQGEMFVPGACFLRAILTMFCICTNRAANQDELSHTTLADFGHLAHTTQHAVVRTTSTWRSNMPLFHYTCIWHLIKHEHRTNIAPALSRQCEMIVTLESNGRSDHTAVAFMSGVRRSASLRGTSEQVRGYKTYWPSQPACCCANFEEIRWHPMAAGELRHLPINVTCHKLTVCLTQKYKAPTLSAIKMCNF